MEVKGILRRAQSLKNVSTDHALSWTEAGLRDRRKSVSQLVAQYQNSPGGKTKTVQSQDVKHELALQVTPIPVNETDGGLDTLERKTKIKERVRTAPLSRSKSMENLPQNKPVGTSALRALFESKVTTPVSKINNMTRVSVGAQKAQALPNNQDAEDTITQAEVNNSHEQVDVTEVDQVSTKGIKVYPDTSASERRKTISTIYTEKISSPEENKRRSFGDFRDSSALGGEKSSVSVRALSALYLSKVAAVDPAENLLKPEQDPISPTGKRPKPSKMAEEAQNISKHQTAIAFEKDDASESHPSTHHLETITGTYPQSLTPEPLIKETMSNLHQQRQKCELRRLLKHTCPELKNVDSLVEEELADILNVDPTTDTEFQSEVQSRRWLFENHAVNTVDFQDQKVQQVKREFQEGNVKGASCLFEQTLSGLHNEGSKGTLNPFASSSEDNKPQSSTQFGTQSKESEEVTSEQNIRVDVKATRRMFETQSISKICLRDDHESPWPIKNVCETESGSDQKLKNDSETWNYNGRTKTLDIHQNFQCNVNSTDSNEVTVGISKAKEIFEKSAHDKEDIPSTNDTASIEEEILKAKVRNRAQMFESIPLDKINQQTKEESDTMQENMQETLISLCNFNIINSKGTILEAIETGHVRKARYNFIQDTRPEIYDEEIVTGSIKNIMLQMLPGTNLNPTVTFLKEDSQGNVEINQVNIPTHQLPFTVHQDKECKTANVVQITEDLLGQETFQGKGVLIQDGPIGTREITVYALFNHSEESTGVVELRERECEFISSSQKKIPGSEKDDLQTDITCTPGAIQENPSAIGLDVNRISNVQLFRSCIEKGDLEHLKQIQKTSSEEDLRASAGEAEETSKITPGNVKNMKAFFTTSLDNANFNVQSVGNKEVKVSPKQSVMTSKSIKTEEPTQAKAEKCTDTVDNIKQDQDQDIKYVCSGNMGDEVVLQAELVDVVEDDELLNLQTAIMNLHQATMEAKALQQSLHAKHQSASPTNQTLEFTDPGLMSHEFTDTKTDSNTSENVKSSEIYKVEQHEKENEEQVMRGGIQAALDSLGRSNFNVTKGDFSAAMIYRNSGKVYAGHKKGSDMEQSSDRIAGSDDMSSVSAPLPQTEQETPKASTRMDTKKDSNTSENVKSSEICEVEQYEKENDEQVTRGGIQAALDSLGRSNINVTKGDFKAAMIYRTSGKVYAGLKKGRDMEQSSDRIAGSEDKSSVSAPLPQTKQETPKATGEEVEIDPCQIMSVNKSMTCSSMTETHVSFNTSFKNHKTPMGPKPAIPPKPDHLKIKPNPNTGVGFNTNADCPNKGQVTTTCSKRPNEDFKERSCPKPCQDPVSYEGVLCKNVQHTLESNESEHCDISINVKKIGNGEGAEDSLRTQSKPNPIQVVEETPKSSPDSILQSVKESSTGFHATLQNFGVKAGGSVPPVKPKRIKMAKDHVKNATESSKTSSTNQQTEITAQCNNPSSHGSDSSLEANKMNINNCQEKNTKCDEQQESGVIMREKKMRGETEDERRQRLSVHMDEIIKGNMTAVMDIFDQLKKQEELQNILSKVEEIEEDTNEVDVTSLRQIFENVPDWVVPRVKKIKPKIVLLEQKGEMPSEPEVMSSMKMAFGDLEKAGAEIIRLKEQTLAKLIDIEEAIKKALYSVSTLKSDSDIAGLSGLFKESMVAVQGSPPSGNIRKISIGSSKSPKAQNQNKPGTLVRGVTGQSTVSTEISKPDLFIPATKLRSASPASPASPSFISIQSAARKRSESPSPLPPQSSPQKVDPKEEVFHPTKNQCCCNDRRICSNTNGASFSPANQRRQVSVLEVQTVPERERVIGTKTVSENYERTDRFGNKFFSSKTSTVVTTQPETRTTSKKHITTSPATSEIVTYPTINTPIIREDRPPL